MSLDGKLGILILTLMALFLTYLDSAGKLSPALALIGGPAIGDAPPVVAAAPAVPTTTTGATGSLLPAPVAQNGTVLGVGSPIQPGTPVTISGINGTINVPYAPPVPR